MYNIQTEIISGFQAVLREVLRQEVRAELQPLQLLYLCPQTGKNSRFDIFDWRGPLVVDEAVVAVDDFLGLPRLVEGRLHLDADKLAH